MRYIYEVGTNLRLKSYMYILDGDWSQKITNFRALLAFNELQIVTQYVYGCLFFLYLVTNIKSCRGIPWDQSGTYVPKHEHQQIAMY